VNVNDPTARYKWVALSNTTLGALIVTINSSIVLISLPAIFRGIRLDPLAPSNISYLLWMLMGYLVVTAVLVVSLGRVGDMFGRVRSYNIGFAIFSLGSIGLSAVFWEGSSAALALIGLRVVQGVGGALLFANSTAIITDAFPSHQRGLALGVNSVAAIAGSFLGLLVGGILSTLNWHLVFLVSVPIGVFGTIWGCLKLREIGRMNRARMDWWGNLTFAAGLILLLVGITYGIQPYGSHTMGWSSPTVLAEVIGGVALLAAFVAVEARIAEPMFRLGLFRIRTFAVGNVASLMASIGRGGLTFMLIIWLQGIWLPLHGYPFDQTPLWSAIYMLPLTIGFLVAAPLAGALSDRFGARPFATGGMLGAAICFGLFLLLPADFAYPPFGLLLLGMGFSLGLFSSPNAAAIMNSVPPEDRGAGSGMRATFMNAGSTLSIGLFFSLIIVGLAGALPGALFHGLSSQGVPPQLATRVAHLPPVGSLFAAFLGYNPMASLLGPALAHLPAGTAAYLTGKEYFPDLISGPFLQGLHITFAFALAMTLVGAGASWLSGGKYVYSAPTAGARREGRPVIAIWTSEGAEGARIGPAVAERLGLPFLGVNLPSELAEHAGGDGTGAVVLAGPEAISLMAYPRTLHVRIFSGEDGQHPTQVARDHLVLDAGRTPPERCVDLIVETARRRFSADAA
jgi:MFS family permease